MHDSPLLHYVHDPMCSWCWGYRPTWLRLRAALPAGLRWTNLLGGLAPDSDAPMPVPMRRQIQAHWQRIHGLLGTPFNFEFWTRCEPRRDTYKACRAVIAAARQGAEEAMIEAIQRGYYLRAMNPSEPGTLVRLASEIGLDADRFAADLSAAGTETEFRHQRALARELGADSFPSLVLRLRGATHPVAVDYRDHEATLGEIRALL